MASTDEEQLTRKLEDIFRFGNNLFDPNLFVVLRRHLQLLICICSSSYDSLPHLRIRIQNHLNLIQSLRGYQDLHCFHLQISRFVCVFSRVPKSICSDEDQFFKDQFDPFNLWDLHLSYDPSPSLLFWPTFPRNLGHPARCHPDLQLTQNLPKK